MDNLEAGKATVEKEKGHRGWKKSYRGSEVESGLVRIELSARGSCTPGCVKPPHLLLTPKGCREKKRQTS